MIDVILMLQSSLFVDIDVDMEKTSIFIVEGGGGG